MLGVNIVIMFILVFIMFIFVFRGFMVIIFWFEEDVDVVIMYCDVMWVWSFIVLERGVVLSLWKVGNEVVLVVEFELDCDFCNERVVKFVEMVEIDVVVVIGNFLELWRWRN